jgi:hypothetical protein
MPGFKSAFASVTIWGQVIAFISLGLGAVFGWQIDAATQAQLAEQTAIIVNNGVLLISAAGTLFGLIMGVWGRIRATKQIMTIALIALALPLLLIVPPAQAQAEGLWRFVRASEKILAALKAEIRRGASGHRGDGEDGEHMAILWTSAERHILAAPDHPRRWRARLARSIAGKNWSGPAAQAGPAELIWSGVSVDLGNAAQYVSAVIAAVSLVYAIVSSRSRAAKDELLKLETRVRHHGAFSVTKIEGDLLHMPKKDNVQEILITLARMDGRMATMEERMRPIASMTERMQDYLMHGEGK